MYKNVIIIICSSTMFKVRPKTVLTSGPRESPVITSLWGGGEGEGEKRRGGRGGEGEWRGREEEREERERGRGREGEGEREREREREVGAHFDEYWVDLN
jgi:hypothetical protein